MGSMKEPVHDRIRDRGFSDVLVPIPDGKLACDDEAACSITILDDLEKVFTLLIVQGLDPEIIDDEDLHSSQFSEMLKVTSGTS